MLPKEERSHCWLWEAKIQSWVQQPLGQPVCPCHWEVGLGVLNFFPRSSPAGMVWHCSLVSSGDRIMAGLYWRVCGGFQTSPMCSSRAVAVCWGEPGGGHGFECSESILTAVNQQESSVVPFPLVPPDPSSSYCLWCIFRIDRRASFFLITFNQCKQAGYPLPCLEFCSQALCCNSSAPFYKSISIMIYSSPLLLWLLDRLPMDQILQYFGKTSFLPFSSIFVFRYLFLFQQLP